MRLLYVCEYATLNGGERSLLAWLPQVINASNHVSILAPRAGSLADALDTLGIDVIPWGIDERSPNKLAARRERLADVITELQPDFIHANSLSMSRVVGPVAAQLEIRSIGHLRDIIGISGQAMRDINTNTRMLAVSHATADSHIANGLSAERTHVLYNGVDLQTFTPRPETKYLHRELQLPGATRLLAAIGQIGMRKGLDVLLSALPRVMLEFPDVQLLIVGQRNSGKREAIEFEQQLHRQASQSPLAGRVHFLGVRDDMPQLLGELAVLVHAARQEPLGRVLLEAAACGIPVVATEVGGTREIFPDDEALLVPPDDVDAMSAALAAALKLGHVYGWSPLQRESFDARISAANLLNHYRALIAGNT